VYRISLFKTRSTKHDKDKYDQIILCKGSNKQLKIYIDKN